ncbi:MAG: arginine--tRNA ligase [Fibrobacterota bacterium]
MPAEPTSIADDIAALLTATVRSLFSETFDRPPFVKKCANPAFGDFQTEFALSASKVLKKNPMDLAAAISAKMAESGLFEKIEPVRPGFINMTMKNRLLEEKATALLPLGGRPVPYLTGTTMVIDYAGPNIAKTLHVGHMRPIIVGDALCRILKAAGATMISDNHIGDWGTQFGKLIVAYRLWKDDTRYAENPVCEMERLYQRFEKEKTEALEDEARAELVKLQQGDPENRRVWEEFVRYSLRDFDEMIARLGVCFDHTLGESFYQPMLTDVVNALLEKGIAHKDQGAILVDTDVRYKIHGPLIVRKKDGAFNYATTDLATLQYRLREWKPGRIVYVTDARQQDHFRSVFAIADEWLGPNAEKAHVCFGSIKGLDGKPFKTREGNTVPLKGLLDEAVERARKVVEEKNPDLPADEKKLIAETVGLGAIKYAELNHDLKSDTLFDWDRMLALEGNTAPYHLYTHARIRSVLRKNEEAHGPLPASPRIAVENGTERNILLLVDGFPLALRNAAAELKPNTITDFIHALTGELNYYYNLKECPVVREPDTAKRESRAAIDRLASDTLRNALSLLGIDALERM